MLLRTELESPTVRDYNSDPLPESPTVLTREMQHERDVFTQLYSHKYKPADKLRIQPQSG